MNSPALSPSRRDALRHKALVLVWIGLLWNSVEAIVALWAGASASSVALMAFGLKSIIELVAGGVLLWHLHGLRNEEEETDAERKAERLIGGTFLLLATYVVIDAALALGGWLPEPEPSLWGVAIAVSSFVVMGVLYVGKMRLAVPLNSRALRGEAIETLMCDVQDLTILVGIGFNALWGWWWADPLASLAMVVFLVKEGIEGLRATDEHGEEGAAKVCFCPSCVYGLNTCKAACCLA